MDIREGGRVPRVQHVEQVATHGQADRVCAARAGDIREEHVIPLANAEGGDRVVSGVDCELASAVENERAL